VLLLAPQAENAHRVVFLEWGTPRARRMLITNWLGLRLSCGAASSECCECEDSARNSCSAFELMPLSDRNAA